jgi:hypothetical protein
VGADGVVTICERLILKKDGGVVLERSIADHGVGLPPRLAAYNFPLGATNPPGYY